MLSRPAVAVLLAAAACLACASGGHAPGRPNILVVVIDALRADHVGAYGGRGDTTPALDRLASQGLRFAHASAPSNRTRTSMPSIWTGLLPSGHGVMDLEDVLRDDVTTAAEVLSAAGYRTGAWCPNVSLHPAFGHAQGWGRYVHEELQPPPHPSKWEIKASAAAINRGFLAWLDEDDEPFLAWLHYLDVHGPYATPPGESADRFQATPRPLTQGELAARPVYLAIDEGGDDLATYVQRYDQGVRHADDRLGELLAELKQRGLLESTIVIVTADHGEAFLEHGLWSHGGSLYEEELHVPLVIAGPGVRPGVSEAVVSTIDLFPTVLELAGSVAPPSDAVTLLPCLRGETPTEARAPVVAEMPTPGGDVAQSVRSENWKLIAEWESRRVALFDLAADPGEVHNLSDEDASRARSLFATIRERPRWRRDATARPPVDPVLLEQLRALGYVR